jgi:hypothetical protein
VPCDRVNLQAVEQARRDAALAAFKARLAAGQASLVIGPRGAVAIRGWAASEAGMTDACVLRRLGNTPEVRRALAAAEARYGSRADLRTAVHSHDGGKTWGT